VMGNEQGKSHKGKDGTAPKGKDGKPDPKVQKLPRFTANSTDPIESIYEVTEKMLGKGNFSTVMLGIHKATGVKVAVKVVEKSGVQNKPEMLKNEVEILSKVDHPNIISLYDIFDTKDRLYLVMELVTGGELFERIVEREQYKESEACIVMKQLFEAIAYLHSLGIVHRDLKPENLLLENENEDTPIKLTDFGLSKIYSSEMMQTACGTPGYVAPEILECGGYDPAVDMWSAGVIMYILLCGYPPFYNENPALLFEAIMSGEYHFHSPYWDGISKEAKDLISKLLVVDPKDRLTAEQAGKHDWFKNVGLINDKPIPGDMRKKLQQHNMDRRSQPSLVDVQKAIVSKKDEKKKKEEAKAAKGEDKNKEKKKK